MHLIQKNGSEHPLLRKLIRARNLAAIFLSDLLCSISWHIIGRYYYPKNFDKLASKHFWCFIVGCNNSGTTVLKKLLDGTGETSSHRYEGQMYTRVLKRARKKNFERIWMEYADELCIPSDHHLKNAPRLLHDWLRSLPKPVKNIIVEKTPANLLRMEWLQKVFPNCLFIGIVRNGYAVAEGIRRKAGQDIDRSADHWSKVNKHMLEKADKINNFFLIRYEDLCEEPERTLKALAPKIGISYEKLLSSYNSFGDISSQRGRITKSFKNYNYASIKKLSYEDKQIITEKASEMLNFFGCEADPKN